MWVYIYVFCVMMVLIVISRGQEVTDTLVETYTTGGIENTTVKDESDVICSVCACDNCKIDCVDRNIKDAFTIKDWKGITNLGILEADISGNTFEVLTQLSALPIEKLNLSYCKIEKIENGCFKYLGNLTVLDLSNNDILTLSKGAFWGLLLPDQTFRPFDKMRYLNLANNELHALPRDAFTFMHDLTFLDLSGNPLRVIDQITMAALSDLALLKEFRLSSCKLETLPDGLLRRQRKLQRLDISNNKFTTIPSELSEAANLVYLNFDKNPITSLTEKTSISSLIKLQELSLCGTKLQTIGAGSLGGLERLISLRVANNLKLNWIDEDFLTWEDDEGKKRWPGMKELHLNNNNISRINPHFLYRWDQLQVMEFDDNPYICDCSSQWMVDVLVPIIISRNGTANNMICSKPHDLRGLSFSKMYELSKTLVCSQAGDLKTKAGPDLALILGIMIGIFATFPIVLIIVLLWRRGYFLRCRQKLNSEDDSDEETDAF